MTFSIAETNPQSGPKVWRSTGAVLLGILVGAALSLGTDQVLHVLKVYPPWGQALHDPGLNLLALSYRCVFNVVGFYVIAQLAPRNPMRHVWVGAAIGFLLTGSAWSPHSRRIWVRSGTPSLWRSRRCLA